MDGQIPRFVDGQKIVRLIFHGERGIHRGFDQLRFIGQKLHHVPGVKNAGGTGGTAVDADLSIPDGILPLGTGTVGEAFRQKQVESLLFRFGRDDRPDRSGFRGGEGSFLHNFSHLRFVFSRSFAII